MKPEQNQGEGSQFNENDLIFCNMCEKSTKRKIFSDSDDSLSAHAIEHKDCFYPECPLCIAHRLMGDYGAHSCEKCGYKFKINGDWQLAHKCEGNGWVSFYEQIYKNLMKGWYK